jgi:hypothetical protein
MVTGSARLGPGSDCSGKAQKQLYKQITDPPLVREDSECPEPHNCQTEKKNVVIGSRWEADTKTDWPTDRRSKLNFNFKVMLQFIKYS